ncbi:MAG: hypothetical protein BGO93_10375 [Mesorhizobium sp. 65-26]|nr:MAG: hypothetical protein BGO93_10375 [Mesorhizobium sp. 65-26]
MRQMHELQAGTSEFLPTGAFEWLPRAASLLLQEIVDSTFHQDRLCDSFRQYAYKKNILCI